MDRLTAMRVFVEVADRGSLTQAAERAGPVARDGQPLPRKPGAVAGRAAAASHDAARQPERCGPGGAAALPADARTGRRGAGRRRRAPQRAGRQAAHHDQPVVRADAAHRRGGGVPGAPSTHRDRTVRGRPCGRTWSTSASTWRCASPIALDDSFVARRLATCRSVLCAVAGLPRSGTAHRQRAGRPEGAQLPHARLRHARRIPSAARRARRSRSR